MKKNYIILAALFIFSFFLASCDTKNEDTTDPVLNDSTKAVIVEGKVVAAESGDNLSGAIIKITDGTIVKGATTDAEGEFSTIFEMEDDRDLTIIAFKAGYFQDTTAVFAIVNTTVSVPLFQLQRDESSNAGGFSGTAASIYLYSQTDQFIGVKESGSIESAQIVFEIMDSSGVVINEENAIDVSFRFGSTPGGGEYLYPSSIRSNALGKAAVSLNTGTIAGVSQIIAEAVVDGKVVRSKPVLISIHGGFPDQGHFHVASKELNYPALGVVGLNIDFTAYVGDKYSNPVRQNTAVYFKANYGIIEGSALTGSLGTGTVTLLTQPWPNDPEFGPGFFRVTATTIDESNNYIETETVRLQSGGPIITVNPGTFNISNGGSQSFSFTVADVNGNPMSQGQSIGVEIESEFYEVTGGSYKLPDTQSEAWTHFSFTLSDTKPDSVFVETIVINIETSGPNDDGSIVFSGTGR